MRRSATVALVVADGAVDWLSLPTIGSPAVFARLLDAERGGSFTLAPEGRFEVERRYLPRTNVLETQFRTGQGTVRVTDALMLQDGIPLSWFELARKLECIDGEVAMHWRVQPRFDFGRSAATLDWVGDVPVLRDGRTLLSVRSFGAGDPIPADGAVAGSCTLAEGGSALLCLISVDGEPLPLPERDEIEARFEGTCGAWRRWADAAVYQGEHRETVVRSALALKLLIYEPSSAVAAAPTTSLPERVGGDKNYDYRYAWVRDAAFTLEALIRLGYREQVHASLSWLLDATKSSHPRLRPMYTLSGSVPDDEVELLLAGYRGSQPVRSGNRAARQRQLGAYGDLMETIALYVRGGNALDGETAVRVRELADVVCASWRNEDSGMWELPEERHYTISKVGCRAALELAVRLADDGHLEGDTDRWRHEAEAIRSFVEEECWSESRGAYALYAGSHDLDAAILRAASWHVFDRDRLAATVEAIREELGEGPLLYRYSGMREREGAFLACSFWLVGVLVQLDRVDEASSLLTELLQLGNDLGLYSEQIDPQTGELLGNFPQGLTHLALIGAAHELEEARSETT